MLTDQPLTQITIHRGVYHDSVTLMRASALASREENVVQVAAVAGTPLNLEMLSNDGFAVPGDDIGPNDLVIAIRASTPAAAEGGLHALEAALRSHAPPEAAPGEAGGGVSLRSVEGLDSRPTVALISIPGEFLAYEIAEALDLGMNVLCFSAGLTLEQERTLKEHAVDRRLLLMGPDCGTSIIDGLGLGFANVVRPGPIGLVGASGTGLQEVMCLLDQVPIGISHAIGVGGRDLSTEVGGIMTEQALRLLSDDDSTEVIVLISKPPDPDVADRIVRICGEIEKPVVVAFLGLDGTRSGGTERGVALARSLEEAAAHAAASLGEDLPPPEHPTVRPRSGHIRGLFGGGSLCYEAMQVVSSMLGPVASNIPLRPDWRLDDVRRSVGHTFVDLGDEQLTRGRPHPMIDPRLRNDRFSDEATDPDVAVCLLDVVLGRGANPDPSEDLVPRIRDALEARGDALAVVIALCGTEGDPQGLASQEQALREAGALVARGAARAAQLALAALGGSAPI